MGMSEKIQIENYYIKKVDINELFILNCSISTYSFLQSGSSFT